MAATPVCDPKSHTCRGCTTDEECLPLACDRENDAQKGQCVQCRFDADCGPNKKCNMHACVDAMVMDAGTVDEGGIGAMPMESGGCGCNHSRTSDGWFVGLLAFLGLASRRRRR